MSRIVILGGGVCGLAAGLCSPATTATTTTLERDPAPVPASPLAAWDAWERTGVPQFRQAHGLQPRGDRGSLARAGRHGAAPLDLDRETVLRLVA